MAFSEGVPELNADTTIHKIQFLQGLYDIEYWQHGKGGLEDLRHVEHHLAKLLGKVATPVEAMEHGLDPSLDQIDSEVIPDLLIWALHLANSRGLRIEELYQRRLQTNINGLHSRDPETSSG